MLEAESDGGGDGSKNRLDEEARGDRRILEGLWENVWRAFDGCIFSLTFNSLSSSADVCYHDRATDAGLGLVSTPCSVCLTLQKTILVNPMSVNIGIDEQSRQEIAQGLSRLLADTYTLYLKTHNFHWNVTGPMFQTLHLMFETQYTELALAVDLIAERIRALGLHAPGTYQQFAQLSSIPEDVNIPSAQDMIQILLDGQEAVVRTARSIFPAVDQAHDEPTADLLTQRMLTHEKNAWMLRSLLG